jgi:hypothetical protein
MTSGATRKPDNGMGPVGWVWFGLCLLDFAVGHWWPDTLAATLASRAFIGYVTIWFVLRIRKGYLLRRPHWTRESWLRYLRLAWMPVVAVAIVLYLSSFDPMTPVLGPRGSARRMFFVIALPVLLVFGAGGLAVAVDWMVRGEPSQQFTRTRWFQRQRPKVTAQ